MHVSIRVLTNVFFRTSIFALFFVASAASAQTSIKHNTGKGHMTWINSTDTEKFEVETKGEVTFKDDDRGIASISPGGRLKASFTSGDAKWKLQVTSSSTGSLSYQYEVDGRKMDYSASSEKELAPYFLTIIRETGVNAEARVARILQSDGPQGVYKEIELINSGSSKVRYLTELVLQGNLNETNLIKTANLAQSEIKSSGDLSRFLIRTNSIFLENKRVRPTYFSTVTSISSSGDKSRVLMGVFDLDIDSETFEQVVNTASSISSSGDKTRVLLAGLDSFPANERARGAYFAAVRTISSSGDRGRLLGALLSTYELDDESAAMAFEATSGMSSSGDKARTLIKAAPHYNNSPKHRELFFNAVSSISSSGDQSRVLLSLLSNGQPNPATIESILQAVEQISSSGDAVRVLVAVSKYVDDDMVDSYLAAAQSVRSDGDRGRALRALMDK